MNRRSTFARLAALMVPALAAAWLWAAAHAQTAPPGTEDEPAPPPACASLSDLMLLDPACLAAAKEVSRHLGQDVRSAAAQGREAAEARAAGLLADAIARWQADALARGTDPIPGAMRAQLEPFFDPVLLDEVRWRVGGEAGDLMPPAVLFRFNDTAALTLGHVVLFRSREDAQKAGLWAHELAHVEQYRHWGIAGFAREYVRDYAKVEEAARQRALDFVVDRTLRDLSDKAPPGAGSGGGAAAGAGRP